MPALIPGFTTPIVYPTSDGKPMAETDDHRQAMVDLIARLTAHFAGRHDVYVSGNLLVYYEEGNINRHLSPDCFVVFGVPNHNRSTFRTWDEEAVPSVVFEITSKTTRREDTRLKRAIYQDVWEVDEYFLFDPLEDYLDPSLQGFRRVRGAFQPIRPAKDGSLTSRRLGLILSRDGERLRLRDSTSGETIQTAEERRAERAEAELARVQAELAALKKKK